MTQEIILELTWIAETDAAMLVEDDAGKRVWLPKSQIDYETGFNIGHTFEFIIPEWLAIEKGLV